MTNVCRSISFVCLVAVTGGGVARAGDTPLIVAVETAPGVDIAPADVREVIATELGTPVVGTRDSAATAAADVLLVAITPHEISMAIAVGQ